MGSFDGLTLMGVQDNPLSVEPYSLGAIYVVSVEPFDLIRSNLLWTTVEPFDLQGFATKSSVEPFYLGVNLHVDSVESFDLADNTSSYLGTNSPASPRLGWRDRS